MQIPVPPRSEQMKIIRVFENLNQANGVLLEAISASVNLLLSFARSLSTKQAVGLVRPSLLDGRCQAIIPFSADDASMTQMLGER
jgi:hypothetical protein